MMTAVATIFIFGLSLTVLPF